VYLPQLGFGLVYPKPFQDCSRELWVGSLA